MKKDSFFLRIFLGYAGITIFLGVTLLLVSFHTVRVHMQAEVAANLESLCRAITPAVLERFPGDFAQLDGYVKMVGRQADARITVTDIAGTVLADSENDPSAMENHAERAEIARALRGGVGRELRYSRTERQKMLYVAVPMLRNGIIAGVIRVSWPARRIDALFAGLRKDALRVSLLFLLLSLFAAAYFSREAYRPFRELKEASRRIAGGDFSARVFLGAAGELKECAESFNAMTEELKSSFVDASGQKERLARVIASLQEGLALIDAQGAVLLANESFRAIVSRADVTGKLVGELLRQPPLDELVNQVRTTGNAGNVEIEESGRVFLCSCGMAGGEHELVLVLHDVSVLKHLEQVKRELAVNASHELRTPLTAIKGYVETLQEHAEGKDREYLDIIDRHADRMIRIVNDLLLLSRLEAQPRTVELADVDMRALIDSVGGAFRTRAEKKGLAFSVQIVPDLPGVRGDAFLLEQMLVNLIDNAIKYTDGGSISITAGHFGNRLSVAVSDTGIGIPAESLPRIFERFYVVDKSRSREAGGTGLGLSIVKHIVTLHQGTIDVRSTTGGGSTFTVLLPITETRTLF